MMRKLSQSFNRATRELSKQLDRDVNVLKNAAVEDVNASVPKQVMAIDGKQPSVAFDAVVAPNAALIGDVTLGNDSSIFNDSVIKGDLNPVRVGGRSNIQDGTVINASDKKHLGLYPGTMIGDYVSIGSGSTLYSCTVENNCIIGK